jgi:hypothetical protein
MDEKSDQIIEHIEAQRTQLGANLNELETKVRRTTDWRAHFDNNPMLMIGAALGGGVLLGAMVGGARSSKGQRANWSESRYYDSSSSYSGADVGPSGFIESSPSSAKRSSPAFQRQKQHASDTVDMIKGALIGFATAKAKEFLGQALPGFDRHLEETERLHGVQRAPDQPAAGSETADKWGGYDRSKETYRSTPAEPVGTPS